MKHASPHGCRTLTLAGGKRTDLLKSGREARRLAAGLPGQYATAINLLRLLSMSVKQDSVGSTAGQQTWLHCFGQNNRHRPAS